MFGRRREEAPKVQDTESSIEKFCKHNKQLGNCDQCMMSEGEALSDAEKVRIAARAHKGFFGYDPKGKLEPSGTDYSEGERWARDGIVKPEKLEELAEFQRELEREIEGLRTQLDMKERHLNEIKRDPRIYLNR